MFLLLGLGNRNLFWYCDFLGRWEKLYCEKLKNTSNFLNRDTLIQTLPTSSDDESLWQMVDCYGKWQAKLFKSYFLLGLLFILATANFWHNLSRISTCTWLEFRYCWIKWCAGNNTNPNPSTIYSIMLSRRLVQTLM